MANVQQNGEVIISHLDLQYKQHTARFDPQSAEWKAIWEQQKPGYKENEEKQKELERKRAERDETKRDKKKKKEREEKRQGKRKPSKTKH